MAGCAPDGGLAGQPRWKAKQFDEKDQFLFQKAMEHLRGSVEGRRILEALSGINITFVKAYMGDASGLNLGHIGHTNANGNWLSSWAEIKIDLFNLRKNIHEDRIPLLLAWCIYHELRHTEAVLVVGEKAGLAIDRNLDFYLYPSLDLSERTFVKQADIPFQAGKEGRAVYQQ